MEQQPSPPPVVKWYRAFCIVAGLAFLVFLLPIGVFFIVSADALANELVTAETIRHTGVMAVVMGIFLGFSNGAVAFLPVKPEVWAVHLTNLLLATMTVVLAPASLALLYYWMKPDVKQYFKVP